MVMFADAVAKFFIVYWSYTYERYDFNTILIDMILLLISIKVFSCEHVLLHHL